MVEDFDYLIVLRNLQIENANAIQGLTYGFPAITAINGFVHKLSRDISKLYQLEFLGSGIVCHKHQIQAYKANPFANYVFSQTRNPLNNKGESPAFIQEGKMHATISLLIPCKGIIRGGSQGPIKFAEILQKKVLKNRFAGGTILELKNIEIIAHNENIEIQEKKTRKLLRSLLPGYALVNRSDLLTEHFERTFEPDSKTQPLDVFLDFVSLKYAAKVNGVFTGP